MKEDIELDSHLVAACQGEFLFYRVLKAICCEVPKACCAWGSKWRSMAVRAEYGEWVGTLASPVLLTHNGVRSLPFYTFLSSFSSGMVRPPSLPLWGQGSV